MIEFEKYFLFAALPIAAYALDALLGEPPRVVHPTVAMGRLCGVFKRILRRRRGVLAKALGIALWLVVVSSSCIAAYALMWAAEEVAGWVGLALVAAYLLKCSFAVKDMEKHVLPVAHALQSGNLSLARKLVAKAVRRPVDSLDEELVASAAVETTAEGFVDGFASPLFYYPLLGVVGAVAYRAVNTLDSEVGYRDELYRDVGWFSAKADTIANYLPARIASLYLILAGWLLGCDWRRGLRALREFRKATESVNAGWPMSAMAGLLGVRLEKRGYYQLGWRLSAITPHHVEKALKVFRLASLLWLASVATASLTLSLLLSPRVVWGVVHVLPKLVNSAAAP